MLGYLFDIESRVLCKQVFLSNVTWAVLKNPDNERFGGRSWRGLK